MFILLVGNRYYPDGWADFKGVFQTEEDAMQKASSLLTDSDRWCEIISTTTWSVVLRGDAEYFSLIVPAYIAWTRKG